MSCHWILLTRWAWTRSTIRRCSPTTTPSPPTSTSSCRRRTRPAQSWGTSGRIFRSLISNISCLKYMSFLLKAKIWLSQTSSFHRQPLFQCKASKVQWPVDPLQRHQPRGLSEDNWLHLPQAPVQSEKRRSRIKLLVHQAGAGSAVSGRQVWVAQAGQVLWRCCGEEDNCNQCQLPAGIETKYYSVVFV